MSTGPEGSAFSYFADKYKKLLAQEGIKVNVAIINNGRLVSCDRMESLLSYDLTHVEVLLDAPAKASTSHGKTASAVAERLREQDWVLSAEAVPGKVLVTLKEPNPQQLAAYMVGAGYRLAGIVPRRRTLQDYFTKTLNP